MAEIGSFGPQLAQKLVPELKAPAQPKTGESTTGASFLEALKGAIGNVNEMQASADQAAQKFATGQGGNLHEVMISMEKAEVSLRTLASVRNKLVEAYQEVMRMQV